MDENNKDSQDISNVFTFEKVINLNSLEDNSIVVFRIEKLEPSVYAAYEKLQEFYGEKLRSKNISFLILKPDTSIETLSPQKMKSLGWVKENQNRIIIR